MAAGGRGSPARRGSPVAVDVLQLLPDAAADAAAVVAVEPLAHHPQADLTLVSVESKVSDLGGDASAPAGTSTPLLGDSGRPGSLGHVPADVSHTGEAKTTAEGAHARTDAYLCVCVLEDTDGLGSL